jgi:hypothetical protein
LLDANGTEIKNGDTVAFITSRSRQSLIIGKVVSNDLYTALHNIVDMKEFVFIKHETKIHRIEKSGRVVVLYRDKDNEKAPD